MNGRPAPGLAAVFRSLAAISTGLLALGLAVTFGGGTWGEGLMRAGLLVLLATPAANVVLVGIEFALQRDWRFAGLAALVLLLLLVSLAVAMSQRI